jgi:serine phosphatase RsbU (regulator of sigma subunit)
VARLRSLVHAHRHASANEILARLFDAVQAFGGTRPWEDDATAVVIRRLESA